LRRFERWQLDRLACRLPQGNRNQNQISLVLSISNKQTLYIYSGRGRTASQAGLGGAGNAISMSGKGAQSIQITDLKSAMRANKMLADEVCRVVSLSICVLIDVCLSHVLYLQLGRPQDFANTNSNMSPQQLKEQLSAHGNAIQSNADELLNQGLVDPDALNRGKTKICIIVLCF
jgi:hypothetical protein